MTVTIKTAAVRAFIRTVPKTAEFKPALQVLKKALTNYEKEPDRTAPENLASAILRGMADLRKRIDQ